MNGVRTNKRSGGFSLLELLAIVTILGVLAAVALPRLSSHGDSAKQAACHARRGNLEVQAQRWYRSKGAWPSSNLSDLAADPDYLPEGLPVCPVDGSAYTFDAATQSISGHDH